ncbi:solute carrier family 22 member 4-like [Biomphalaria glabrata]|uniref:Solute carrier family 22 member 4-like n=1 Tax=Biomphalaria glabrata TaxID=6526 RepID=A0A9W3B1C7_BIOGL|nr:solute carrier family 22 member 4-like [Biomphalaria glabrata]XP_055893265.1 solute carrier family 22 member 4-like [Biomphalaria glabrata]XP_055893266.1 solute carrier family 22 member 4-like [Biomphalaria glabrata]XP_055893268.1 solute carrier family 22 member 4-like [Biomphalaria glabrata]XP_055893269.1 solute carrier family 22 member 4-like [Biomphalaria glabrata]
MEQGAVIDQVLYALKWNGFYQKSRLGIILAAYVTGALHYISVVFIGRSVPHQCRRLLSLNLTIHDESFDVLSNSTDMPYRVSYGQCRIDVKNDTDVIFTTHCREGYEYVEAKMSSFVSEWDLVCEKEYFSDVSQTVLAGGYIFGALFLSRFADAYGRKVPYVLANLVFFVAEVVSAFSPTYIFFIVLKFILGASGACMYQFGHIQLLELMPTSHRALIEKLNSFMWTASMLLLCLVAYLTRDLDWQYTMVILAMFTNYAPFLWWTTDESIRWLCASKRYQEVERIVEKIARINGVDPKTALDVLKENGYSHKDQELNDIGLEVLPDSVPQVTSAVDQQGNNDIKLSKLLINRRFLIVTSITSSIWFVDALSYDGLLLVSPSLHEDFYLGFVLAVVIEFPATILFCLLINRIGRKKCIAIFHLLAGFFLVVSTVLLQTTISEYIPYHYWISLLLSLLGRLALTTGYSSVLIFVPESFPTSVRNIGFGMTCAVSSSASLLAPYTRTLSRHLPWAPNVCFGVMCIVVPLLVVFLPETRGLELSQTLDDMEKVTQKTTKTQPQ